MSEERKEVEVPEELEFAKEYIEKSYLMKPNRIVIEIKPEKIREFLTQLSKTLEDRGKKFYLSTIAGTDLIDKNVIQLDYHLIILPPGQGIVVRTYLPRDNPRIDSILDLIPGAFSGECETYDLLGIVFEGNKYLKRGFFVPIDITEKNIFPLRKDSGV
ncbi:MAG: NADH-quinone oxidoreductase subunit C [Thermoprotei archaeon]|nr:MAG: NADH-quinone oxidoreductase subunit C [Thermoprotei archaeon]